MLLRGVSGLMKIHVLWLRVKSITARNLHLYACTSNAVDCILVSATDSGMKSQFSQAEMEARLVRYAQLRPCTTAFIDTRTPGSELKENFTIIGAGVAENPEQHVHIDLPHGFNIGGARQPPHCVNSQHSHDTAEVFVVHSGNWRFKTGHDGCGAHVDLQPGDTISIPTRIFRGFENIGQDTGFLFAVLGGDDPGRVTWAPYVFEAAERTGLVLLENGRLIDTQHEQVPEGARRMRPTTAADLAAFTEVDGETLRNCVMSTEEFSSAGGLTAHPGLAEFPIIGSASPAEHLAAGKMAWPHGFQLRALHISPGARSPAHTREEPEVLLVHAGEPFIEWPGGRIALGPGDTLTVPIGIERIYGNDGRGEAQLYVVHGGDHPRPPTYPIALSSS